MTQSHFEDVVKLVCALRMALDALESESASWQAEGYQGEYHEDEVKKIRAILSDFAWVGISPMTNSPASRK